MGEEHSVLLTFINKKRGDSGTMKVIKIIIAGQISAMPRGPRHFAEGSEAKKNAMPI